MDDKTLLERAAKAAGVEIVGPVEKFIVQFDERHRGGFIVANAQGGQQAWNPLRDDGDEARLEGALCFNVTWGMASVTVGGCTERFSGQGGHDGDKQKARRWAGVRAAAAIGRVE